MSLKTKASRSEKIRTFVNYLRTAKWVRNLRVEGGRKITYEALDFSQLIEIYLRTSLRKFGLRLRWFDVKPVNEEKVKVTVEV